MKSNKEFEKNGIIVLLLTSFGSGINYLSQILMGRTLGVENYGLLNSVFSWMLITGVIGTTLGMMASRNIASCNEDKEKVIGIIAQSNRKFLSLCMVAIVGFGIVVFLFYPMAEKRMKVLIIVSLISNLLPLYFQGVLGGMQKFLKMAMVCVITPLCKIGVVMLLLFSKPSEANGVDYVLISIILGGILVTVFSMYFIVKDGYCHRVTFEKKKSEERETAILFLVNVLLMVLMNADVLYMERVVGKAETGLYSATLMFGRILYFGSTALVSVLLPMVALEKEKGDGREKILLRKTMLFLIFGAVCLLVPLNIFSREVLFYIYGKQYMVASKYTIYASLISVGSSFNVVMMNYMLGTKKIERFGISLLLGLIFISFIILFLKQYESIVLLSMGLVSVMVALYNWLFCSRKVR